MKIIFLLLLGLLIFLSVSSGVTKIMLMPQDLNFFTQYGFSELTLQIFGAAQVVGGILLAIPSLRIFGALIVALTFVISMAILIVAGNIVMAAITLLVTLLLAIVVIKIRKHSAQVQA